MQTFLEIGLSNAVMASVLAVLAAGAGFFCRRPAVRHTLWLLVLLKLVTPPLMSVPVACPSSLETFFALGTMSSPASRPADSEGDAVRNASPYQVACHGDEDLILDDFDSVPAAAEISPLRSSNQRESVEPASTPTSPSTSSALPPIAFGVWLTGTGLWLVVAGTRICCFQRLLRYGKAAPAPLQQQTCLLAQRLGLARCPTVWLVPGHVSPLLWALGKDFYLVLPINLMTRLGPQEQASLLAHELAHARRRDHWVRWLEFVVSGLYWWLPVVWWARRQLQQAEEECCDAWVVWTLPTAAKAYAKALLQTVDFLDARPALPPVASGIGHLRLLRRRLTMIVRQPLYPQLPWPVHLGVIVLGLLVLPIAPQRLVAQAPEEKPAFALSDDTALVQTEQDSSNRDLDRRLRTLEERMDRLLQKLETQRGERFDGKSSREERSSAAEEKARAKDKEKADKAKEKAKTDQLKDLKRRAEQDSLKDLKRRTEDGKTLSSEQVERAMKEMQQKLSREFDPERMKDLQKRIQEAVDKSMSPARMEAIQRKVEEAFKKSEEALKRSTADLDRAKQRLQQAAEQKRTAEAQRPREPEQRNLERRMDRLEQKMDRVLQALEKPGRSSREGS
jgi:bla regulator protein BlaR1